MRPYDETAEEYERHVAPKYRPIAQLVARRAVMGPRDDVVEVAAGTGLLTRLLAQRCSGTYLATDVSAPMLDVARALLPEHVTVATADARSLPTADGSADLVVSSLGPLQESDDALAEARRVLRPGGRMVLSTWGDAYAERDLLGRVRARLGCGELPPPPDRLADRVRAAGFRCARVRSLRLPVAHASVAAYVDYRAAFGCPPWLAQDRFQESLHLIADEAAEYVDERGTVRLDWSITVVDAAA